MNAFGRHSQQAYPAGYPQPAPQGAPINVAPPPPPEEPPPAANGDEVAAMRHELDELKQMLRDSMAAKKPKKPKKPV